MKTMRLKLTSDGTMLGTYITDADTGAVLNVLKATWECDANDKETRGRPIATLTVLIDDVDITQEMDVDEVRLSDLRQRQNAIEVHVGPERDDSGTFAKSLSDALTAFAEGEIADGRAHPPSMPEPR